MADVFLGIGSKLFAVPWNALEVDTEHERLIADISKEKLENAEGFDDDNWPNFADRTWGTRVHAAYGANPFWTT